MIWLTILRDVLIIGVAVLSLIAIGLAIYVVFQILALVRTLRAQVPPLFDAARETAGTIEGTVSFINEKAVAPTVRGAAITAALIRFLQVLTRGEEARRP